MAKTEVFVGLVVATLVALVSAQQSLPLLANGFGDNMVLAANIPLRFWGWTNEPNTMVDVSIFVNGVKVNSMYTYSDSSPEHRWQLVFPQGMPVEKRPGIVIVETASQRHIVSNVLFGDVFICAGGSNMVMGVSAASNASFEIPQGNKFHQIRLFTVSREVRSTALQRQYESIDQHWAVANSEEIGNGNWTYFSATCWYFARETYLRTGTPIGLVSLSWKDSYIQSWTSESVQKKCEKIKPQPYGPKPNSPTTLFNSMLNPAIGMASHGIIWYQGEANIGYAEAYSCYFKAMIDDLYNRQIGVGLKPAPIFYVQLAGSTISNPADPFALPALRSAQMVGLLGFGAYGVTALDLGEPGTWCPKDKQTLGKRLAMAVTAKRDPYPRMYQGAYLKRAYQYSTRWDGTVYLEFDTNGACLVLKRPECPHGNSACSAFEIQLDNGSWVPASPSIGCANSKTQTVWLSTSLAGGTYARAVRYAYQAWPRAVLSDKQGLPAWPVNEQVVVLK